MGFMVNVHFSLEARAKCMHLQWRIHGVWGWPRPPLRLLSGWQICPNQMVFRGGVRLPNSEPPKKSIMTTLWFSIAQNWSHLDSNALKYVGGCSSTPDPASEVLLYWYCYSIPVRENSMYFIFIPVLVSAIPDFFPVLYPNLPVHHMHCICILIR